jgi:hypothetical protein
VLPTGRNFDRKKGEKGLKSGPEKKSETSAGKTKKAF